jgi:allantoinase
MPMSSRIVRSRRVVLPGGMRPAAIHIEGERIVAINPHDAPVTTNLPTIDAGSMVVMPGLVDTHVHINEPGRTDWEGFDTATRAAAAGGVTTLVDMPLNSIPATTTVAALEAKRRAAEARCHVDVGFWGGVVPGNIQDLEPLARVGVLGFKCFLSPSGVDQFAHVNAQDLRAAMPVLARLGRPLLAHAELPELLGIPDRGRDPRQYDTWLQSRPPVAEHAAIDLLIALSAETGARVHVVHLASSGALPAITNALDLEVPISVETCPHYLTFCAEEIAEGGTAWKCAPPIREHEHRERLWRALVDGPITLVATDHSPAPPSLKHLDEGNFVAAWGGIASLQVSLPVMWTGAARRGISIERLAEWMSAAPAKLAGLTRKGGIAVGLDADLVIVDPDREQTVDATRLYHRHPVSPYHGATLRGQVMMTMLRGQVVFEHGQCVGHPTGRLLPSS